MPLKPRVSMGVEVEFFAICMPGYTITRRIVQPDRLLEERGEVFTSDKSVGTEYDSMVFYSLREALFLLKSGLRKFFLKRYSYSRQTKVESIAFLGGWKDRFAGSHFHLARGLSGIPKGQADRLSEHIHDHIPFFIAFCANSPIWRAKVTKYASNRFLLGSRQYCLVTKRGVLDRYHYDEINYNTTRGTKPSTLELRVGDSNIPEYLSASLVILKAIALACLQGRRPSNICSHENYLIARESAAREGVKATLFWKDRRVSARDYVDLLFKYYRREIEEMDVPDELLDVFKLFKLGFNGAEMVRRSCTSLRRSHPVTWRMHFGKKYALAVEQLLNGETIRVFARQLGVRLPSADGVELGSADSVMKRPSVIRDRLRWRN